MTWLPSPSVTIGTAVFTGDTVGQVSVRRGRDTVYAQTQAGYASFELIDVDGLVQPQVGSRVTFTLNDSGGTAVPVFVGQISDWDGDAVPAQGRTVVRYRLQAVGPLARLNRRTVLFDGRPQELDGARVSAAVADGLSSAWEEVGSVTWGGVDPTLTYETFDPGVDLALIDSGVFQIAALGTADAGYNALQVAQEAATSAEGVLFETGDGFIGYADSDRRFTSALAGFDGLPFAQVSAGGVMVSQKFADVTNRVTVEFDGGAVTETFQESVNVFGEVLASQLSTNLADTSSAEQKAEAFLERHAERSRQLGRVEFNLRGVSDSVRDLLLTLNTNSAVELTGMPAKLGFTQFAGFVEGVDFSFDEFSARLGLLISEEALSTGAVRWSVVSQSLEWGDVDATLEWQDARSV